MATKVKPSRLQVSGTPQVGQVPVYVDEDSFQWGDKGEVSDVAYGSSWDGDTTHAPSKNAVYDKVESVEGEISTINGLIPVAATTSNQLADKDFVNDGINSVTAYYITKNANGDQFATYAELSSATTFYSGGVARVPTRNDYTIVLADENHDNATTRYIYNSGWEYQYTVNETALTQAQLDALNSGITANKVSTYDGYATSKQNTLTAQTAYTSQGGASKVPQITTNSLGQVTGITEVNITYPSQVSDTAYGNGWDGDTTTAPSKNAVYDKISAMDTTISGKQDTLVSGTNIKTINGTDILGSGDITIQGGTDYSWVTKTISGGAVEIGLRTIVNIPTSNFTLNAPATLKEGEEYVIRVINEVGYTITLGSGFTNPRNVDLNLSRFATDQFVFVAINGTLELQPLFN